MTASPNLGGMFNTDITVLTLHRFFERFCYYGLRSTVVLYLISSVAEGGLGIENGQALEWYGWFTGLSFVSAFLAGFVGDYLVRSRTLMWIGGFTSSLGLMALALHNDVITLYALLAISIGSGVYMCSHQVCIAQSYRHDPLRMDGGFLLNYIAVNLGAFVGIVMLSSLIAMEEVSFSSVYLCLGALLLVAQLLLVSAHRWMSTVPSGANDAITDPPYYRQPSWRKFRMLALLMIGSVVFWTGIELSSSLFFHASDGDSKAQELLYSQTFNLAFLIPLLLALILLKAFSKISTVRILATGLLCAATAFFYQFTQFESMSYDTIILVSLGLTISEGILVLIGPILGRYFPQRHLGKVFGLTFLVFSASRLLQIVSIEIQEFRPVLLAIYALVLLLIAAALLMLRPASSIKSQLVVEAEEYI